MEQEPIIERTNIMPSANRYGQKLKSVIKATQPSSEATLSPRKLGDDDRRKEESRKDEGFRLPDIRRAAAPIKRAAPRIQYHKLAEEQACDYIQPAPEVQIMRQPSKRIEVVEVEKSGRLKKLYEELNKHRVAYYGNQLGGEKVRPPIIQNVYQNAYHIYQQPVIVKPSWWG